MTNRWIIFLEDWLYHSRKSEDDELMSAPFVATIAKGYKVSMLLTAVFGIGIWYLQWAILQEREISVLFGGLGLIALLMLPTYYSYRCYVDQTVLEERYWIVFIPIRKKVLWEDVAYKRVKRDYYGKKKSVCLYNRDQKKLIAFDYTVAGFGIILRMTKRFPAMK